MRPSATYHDGDFEDFGEEHLIRVFPDGKISVTVSTIKSGGA